MKLSERVVTQIPIQELWTDNEVLHAKRSRYLKLQDIRELLRVGPVQFVVGDVGNKLDWIREDQAYSFWKDEVKAHLNNEQQGHLDDYPDGYFYFASEWLDPRGLRIVLLEKYH